MGWLWLHSYVNKWGRSYGHLSWNYWKKRFSVIIQIGIKPTTQLTRSSCSFTEVALISPWALELFSAVLSPVAEGRSFILCYFLSDISICLICICWLHKALNCSCTTANLLFWDECEFQLHFACFQTINPKCSCTENLSSWEAFHSQKQNLFYTVIWHYQSYLVPQNRKQNYAR